MHKLEWLGAGIVVRIGAATSAFVGLALYDVAGHTPHTRPVYSSLESTRQHQLDPRTPMPNLDAGERDARDIAAYLGTLR